MQEAIAAAEEELTERHQHQLLLVGEELRASQAQLLVLHAASEEAAKDLIESRDQTINQRDEKRAAMVAQNQMLQGLEDLNQEVADAQKEVAEAV